LGASDVNQALERALQPLTMQAATKLLLPLGALHDGREGAAARVLTSSVDQPSATGS
jgi:hypothetical protein